MLRIAATIGLKTYYFASEDVDYDNTFWEARISNQFEIERFFDISESTGNRIRSIQITLDNRDNFFKDIEKNDSLLNSKFVLYFNDGDDKVKTFTGIVNKIDSFGDDVSLTLMERGYEYLKNNFPDAQIAYDYYSESGINDNWNAIPIPFGIVNKIPLAWVNLLRSEFIIGSGPLFNVNKLYFDKVVVYDRITEKNGYQPTPESPEIKFRIFKGTGSIGSPEVVDGVKSEYPGFAYVQLYKIVDGVEEPADPLTPDGDVSQIYADIEGIVNDTGTAPERNPIKILYMLFTKPYTGYEGYGLEIDPDDLDFDDAILEANIQGFKIDGAIDRIAEFGEWVDELLRCARASLTEEDGKIKVYVDSPKTYSGVHFDASGDNGYECDISPWTEPEVDAQINRLRLSYSWNFERNDFNKKPGVHEESPLRDPYLKDEAHAVRIGKWNTDTIEFKLIKDDTTAHKLAQYYLKSKVKQLKTTSLVTEVNIPNIDAGDLVKVSYEKFGWVEKDFVVTKIKRNEDSTELDIKEYSIDVYTFVSPGEEPEVPGNPYSPYNIPTKPIMNSLEVVNTILQDGSNQTLIKVEFTHTSENAHMVALYFKEASEPESAFWQLDATVNKNVITTIWKGRVTGDYNFRLATITSMGVTSPITIEDGDRHYYGQPTEEVPVSVHVDTEAPGTPSISIVNPFVGGVSIYITIPDGVPEDFAYFKIFRKLGDSTPALLATYHTSAVFTDSERETIEHSRVYYAVAVDRNGNESAMSAASAASTPLKVGDADLSADAIKMPTGALLSLTAKNCTTTSIAEVGGVKDVSGNGNHGQAFGGVEVVDSEIGKAFHFDGIDDYVLGNNIGFPGDVTLAAWIRPGVVDAAAHGILGNFRVGSPTPYRGISLSLRYSGIYVYCASADGHSTYIARQVAIVANEWQHVAMTLNVATKTFTLYYNGISIHSQSTTADIDITHSVPFIMGRVYSNSNGSRFDGLIAHPKIFKRALSPSEIKTLYMFPDDVAFGQITTDFIGANAVTAGKTLLAAIDDVTGNLNNNVVGELQLVNDAVTEAKIAVNAVNTGQINNQALKAPSGALLSLTAKNCTTASIAEVDGVKDVSGNGNHGQAFGGVEVVDSEMGKAFRQSGSRHIQISGTGLTATDRTFSCWIKKTNETNAWGQILAQNTAYSAGNDTNITGLWTNSVGEIRFQVGWSKVFGLVPTPNRFYHVVGVIEGNVALKLYIDGILVNSKTLNFNPQTDGLSVFIGGFSSTPEFDCFDPRVYNRALSPSEIKTLYMFPGDVAFGQITTDFIGANAVNTGQINNQALKAPSGALLSLTAKNCTTTSIAEVGGVKDVSGNGNHGRAYGGVEVVDTEMGKAFKFDGVNDYVLGGNIGFPGDVTLAAWIRPELIDTVARGILGNQITTKPRRGISLFHVSNKLGVEMGTGVGGSFVIASPTATIVANEWQHVAVTLNITTKTFTFYYNGLSIGSQSTTNEIDVATSVPFVMGRLVSNAGNYTFGGLIAHPKIFKRALSASEIKTLYMFPDDVAFGQITADLVTTGELITKSAQIADAIISNAHIHDLSADKINAGTLAAERIAAGSINASKLLIGRVGAALNDDPNFEDPSAWIKPINGTFASVTDGQVGGTVARQSVGYGIWRNVKYIPIDRSKTYRVRLWIRTDSAGNGVSKPVSIGTNYYTAMGGIEDTWLSHSDTPIPITTNWTEFSYIIPGSEFPHTAKYMRNRIGLFNGNGAGYHEMQDLRIEEVIPATLIQDGSIITEKLAVGAVTAEKLLIGKSGAALNDDPNFEDPSAWEKSPYQPFNFNYTLIPDGKVGRYGIRSVSGEIASVMTVKDIPYDPSKTYRIRAWVRATVSTATPSYLGVRWINSSGDNGETSITIPVSPIDWTEYVVFIGDGTENTAPENTVAVRPYFIANIAEVTGVVFDIQDLRIEECVPSTLIKDGAIRTQHITVEGLDAGKITSGELKSRNYVAPAVGESFAQAGSTYDLDNASIITENFYSNETGAGIKGHIEADTGRIGRWNIGNTGRLYVNVENFNEADPALELTADVSNEAEDERILQKVFLGWGGEDAELLLSQEESILSTGVPQDSWYTTIRPWRITCKVNNSSTTIDAYKIATYPLNSPKAAIVGDMGDGELKFTVMDNNQLGTLGVKTLTLAGKSTTTVTINADNPKIVFENMNHTQIAALVFSASDSYTPPMSVSLVGNQGNEVFAAPRFRANAPTGPASVLLSGGINSYGESVNFGLMQSSAAPMIGYGVKPHPSLNPAFVSSYGAILGRIALLLDGIGFRVFTGGNQNVPVDTPVSMTERFKIDPAGVLTLNGYATSQRRDANGYLNFNGIKIAWGQFTSNATASQPITMHTEFVQPPRIALTLATSSAVTTYFARAYDRTTTSFYCNSNVTASVMYIAVGY